MSQNPLPILPAGVLGALRDPEFTDPGRERLFQRMCDLRNALLNVGIPDPALAWEMGFLYACGRVAYFEDLEMIASLEDSLEYDTRLMDLLPVSAENDPREQFHEGVALNLANSSLLQRQDMLSLLVKAVTEVWGDPEKHESDLEEHYRRKKGAAVLMIEALGGLEDVPRAAAQAAQFGGFMYVLCSDGLPPADLLERRMRNG